MVEREQDVQIQLMHALIPDLTLFVVDPDDRNTEVIPPSCPQSDDHSNFDFYNILINFY